jgi:starch phosphorylase
LQALAAISSGVFSPDDRNRFTGLMDGIYNHDWFMVAADFDAYSKAQRDGRCHLADKTSWYSKTIRNVARMGWFSSDRTIRQYAKEIWRA